ncbi:protein kinase domain-containing protein [Gordonia polyisoprenivorans]|uniref:protein kinase domain-containing protein n=1 Tax=Gordonia polyisoprenivorans TaxID=84595 RepID=UPI0003667563|nr:protein kinase [Gordonia polyisoprenivorans]
MAIEIGGDFAGYRVLDELGAGGMGTVYLVEHHHLLRREALKVISVAAKTDTEFQRRFTNEARTAAGLRHPNIVTIHNFSVTDGSPWFTMTHYEGHDLTEQRSLPDSEIVTIATRVSDALDYAHSQGVIHRDIKPANIIVTRKPGLGIDEVVVLDFGIARLATASRLTATNGFIGTLSYSAPEVIDGQDATAASDQYSLACTLYELICGRPPFTAPSPSALMMAHLQKRPPPIHAHRPELARVDSVISRAMAKNQSQRYPNCRALAIALAHALDPREVKRPAPAAPTLPAADRTPVPNPSASVGPTTSVRGKDMKSESLRPEAASHFLPTEVAKSKPGRTKARRTAAVGLAVVLVVAAAVSAILIYQHLSAPKGVTAISSGAATCAVADGAAFCWGNHLRQQTDNSDRFTRPTRVPDITHPTAITTNGSTSCAIADGGAYCWGGNVFGQLGNGTTTSSANPSQVVGLSDPSHITTDGDSTCAIADGGAFCWGANSFGQLGDGTTTERHIPTRVPDLDNPSSITTGNGTTCAISNKAAYCWGNNADGQLGNPSLGSSRAPVPVPALTNVTAINTRNNTTCAVADGGVFCWGNNAAGQVGDGTITNATHPIKVSFLPDPTDVSVGDYVTCAVAAREAYCWGDNSSGQLGDGTTIPSKIPSLVVGVDDVTAVSAGVNTVCAVGGGKAYCWGDNTSAQIGDGTTDPRTRPRTVTFP